MILNKNRFREWAGPVRGSHSAKLVWIAIFSIIALQASLIHWAHGDDEVPVVIAQTTPVVVADDHEEIDRVWQEVGFVTLSSDENLDEALVRAAAEFATLKANNPSMKLEVLAIETKEAGSEPSLSAVNTSADAIAERLGWQNVLDSRIQFSKQRLKKWSPAIEAIKRRFSNSIPFFVGQSPALAEGNIKFQRALIRISTISTFGIVGTTLIVSDSSSIPKALAISLLPAVYSYLSQKYHNGLIQWIASEGPLGRTAVKVNAPNWAKRASTWLDSALREYSLILLFYGSIEFLRGYAGFRSNILAELSHNETFWLGIKEFITGPMYESLTALASEGIAQIGLSLATKKMLERNKDMRTEVNRFSNSWSLGIELTAILGVVMDMLGMPFGHVVLGSLSVVGGVNILATYFETGMKVIEGVFHRVNQQIEKIKDRLESRLERKCSKAFLPQHLPIKH